MAAMAVADSAFAYLNATGSYATGSPSDFGWVAAFLLLALAGADTGTRTVPAMITAQKVAATPPRSGPAWFKRSASHSPCAAGWSPSGRASG